MTTTLARVRDAEAIHALLWSVREDIPLGGAFNSPDRVDWVRDRCRERSVSIVMVGGRVAGAMVMMADEVFYLAVATDFRRRGIARELLSYAKRRMPMLIAKTKAQNERTQALLVSEAFVRDLDLHAQAGWFAYKWERRRRNLNRAAEQ